VPPVEPPPSRWHLDLSTAEPGEDLVGIGADLEPGTLLAAYRAGLFPMGTGRGGRAAGGGGGAARPAVRVTLRTAPLTTPMMTP
jgi:hypothetical protein